MRKAVLIFLVLSTIFVVYGKTNEDMRLLEESITKDYDQDGKYSAYEKALRRAQESIYVALPEKKVIGIQCWKKSKLKKRNYILM